MAYDFIFINNGSPLDIYSFQGTREIFFWTKEKLSEKTFEKIKKVCPKILKGTFKWTDNLIGNYLFFDEDEIMIHYSTKLGKEFELDETGLTEIYKNFANDLEGFVIEANKISPLYLAIGIERICGSKWDNWSIEQINEIVARIEEELGKSPGKDELLNLALEKLYQRHGISTADKNKIKQLIE